MRKDPVVSLEGVEKSYSMAGIDIEILRGVNLEVGRGEVVSILGSYGSGRTCLLSIIGLITRPSSGRVLICGKDTTRLSRGSMESLRTRKVGFLSRAFGLIPDLTVLENLELAFQINGEEGIEEQITRALTDADMEGGEYRMARSLSPLESRMLSISKNMGGEVSLLVCDDPAAGLSERDSLKIVRMLKKANRETGISIILGTPGPRTEFDIETAIRIENGLATREPPDGI